MKKNKKKEKFVLIDGNALIHRAYHAIPGLTTKQGELVNAVFGFTSVLLKAINDLKPTHIAIAFDVKGPTFRHKMYKEYKATRVKAPDDLYNQFPRVKEVVKALNIPMYEQPGFEADDIVGTLSKKLKIDNVIVTGDLDELQLVDDNTIVYTMRRGMQDTVIYDEKKVYERFGIKPNQLIDYKGLRGDPSDNIPGVRGIGEKTASALLQKFGTIEKMYEVLEKCEKIEGVPDKIRKLLIEQKDQAFMSKKLATIIIDMPLKIELRKCEVSDYDRGKVAKLFQELEFKSLLLRLPKSEKEKEGKQQGFDFDKKSKEKTDKKKKEIDLKKSNYELIDSESKFSNLINELKSLEEFAIDTETTSTFPMEAELVGISFAKNKKSWYLPVDIIEKNNDLKFKLKDILENKEIKKIAHNAKYDLIVLRNYGMDLKGISFDTMVASYVLSPSSRRHGLDNVAFQELGYEMMTFEELVGTGKDKKDIREVELEKLAFYSCEDADITLRLKNIFEKRLKEKKKLWEVFWDIEMSLINILALMEMTGVKIDLEFLNKLSKNFTKKLDRLVDEIYNLAGTRDFNINSTQQLSKILFEKLKIPVKGVKKTTTGYSTAAKELAKIKQYHSIITLIEQHREYAKLISTYVDALPKLVYKKTGRIHTSFNQTITSTGRLSSSDPNIQNIPIRTEEGREIRKAFVSEKGYAMLSADYSQVELRLVAHMSKDGNLLNAFKRNEDIHAATAALIFNKNIKDVNYNERRIAKTVNFGIMYGMGSRALSQNLDITTQEAKEFIDKYFEAFPSIASYIDKTLDFARKNGYVETMFGRRRYLPELSSTQTQVKAAAERMAVNMPLQGTAADIIKIAMINMEHKFNLDYRAIEGCDLKMILQVHDELVFEVSEGKIKEYAKEIKQIMENAFKISIPLKVDISVGRNWGDMEELAL